MIVLYSFFFFPIWISLDPDSDPLCMLLLIDFLALRSREYQSVLQLYQDWEVKCALTFCVRAGVSVPLLNFQSVTGIVCFCFSGAQKSVSAAKLCILHCPLSFSSKSAGKYGPWRKSQTKAQSRPAAADCPHHVPCRLDPQQWTESNGCPLFSSSYSKAYSKEF